MHASTESVLRYFDAAHLPERLQAVARPFGELAHLMADQLDGPEVTAGLRKLLEAKDCCVRAALDVSGVKHTFPTISTILERLKHMATQADIDRITQTITDAETNIRQDIADLKAANPGVDTTALEASVSALTALADENPANPPA